MDLFYRIEWPCHSVIFNYMPHSVDVAIPRKSRVSTLPDWPSIDLYYYTDYRYNLGIEENNNIRIYDIEKNSRRYYLL